MPGELRVIYNRRHLLPVIIAVLISVLSAGSGYAGSISAFNRLMLPDQIESAPGQVLTAIPGQVLFSAKPGWVRAARLDDGARFDVEKKTIHLDPGSVVVLAGYHGEGPSILSDGASVYCGQASYEMQRAGSIVNILIARIEENRSPIVADGSLCLVDTDSDGGFDAILRPGLKGSMGPRVVPIASINYSIIEDYVSPGESYIKISYRGLSMRGDLKFQIEFKDIGLSEEFQSFNVINDNGVEKYYSINLVSKNNLPQSFSIAGAKMTLLDYDKSTKAIKLQIDEPLQRKLFGLTVERVLYR